MARNFTRDLGAVVVECGVERPRGGLVFVSLGRRYVWRGYRQCAFCGGRTAAGEKDSWVVHERCVEGPVWRWVSRALRRVQCLAGRCRECGVELESGYSYRCAACNEKRGRRVHR